MATTHTLTLEIPAFENNASIPAIHTCDGSGISPRVLISGVPEGTKSLVLIADDPDVPKQILSSGVFDHWVLYNIPPQTNEIPEGKSVGMPGLNGANKSAYAPPCPPLQYQPSEHRYMFTLYALDSELSFASIPTKNNIIVAMSGHVLAQAHYVGRYKRRE